MNHTDPQPVAAHTERGVDIAIGLVLFAAHLALYWSTLTPGLAFEVDPLNPAGDSHEFTMAIAELRLARRTGYPLYTWLGFLFTRIVPFGELAYRTNLLSAVFGAAGVVMLFAVARKLSLRPAAAAFAAFSFGITTHFWSQAVITEVYTFNILALGLVLWLLIAWSQERTTAAFAKFALAYGVSIGCHTSNLSLGAVFALFVLVTDPGILKNLRALSFGVLAFLIGISQYLWLPLMADTAQFPNPTPDTWTGFYKYTIGAFSNLRFAFPLDRLPERFLLYLRLLRENFTLLGIAIGLIGMAVLLRRRRALFLLLCGVFAVNVVIAMQVAATDLQVFFLPSYLTWAVFLGIGVDALWTALDAAAAGSHPPLRMRWRQALRLALVLVLAGWGAWLMRSSFHDNDRTSDTAFEDFYDVVFAILPPNTYLTPGPGVFGQGAVYYQKVLGRRPDVTIYTKRGRMKMPPELVFSPLNVKNGRGRAPFTAPPFPPNAWMIPVLVGNHPNLILYRVDRDPPRLLLKETQEQPEVDSEIESARLIHSRVEVVNEPPRPRLRVELHWRLPFPAVARRRAVATRVDGQMIDSRPLGLGNLRRYAEEVERIERNVVVESYDLVLPRHVQPGPHTIEFGLVEIIGREADRTWFGAQKFSIP